VAVQIELVVKVGGGLLTEAGRLDGVLATIAGVGRDLPLVIVPGGGPFADVVRDIDHRMGLLDDAAHGMAILAMDQFAHLMVSRLSGSVLATGPLEMSAALAAAHIPVLAPYRWLRDADALPHSWDVTSDSIAAWVAGELGAARLVLVKPPGASGDALVDPYFSRALPSRVTATTVPFDDMRALRAALCGSD
jgi:aspartokinase-like uncharacterized kinase